MPTVLSIGPYRFFFYANEGNEPSHVHVKAAEREAKYWLEPVSVDRNKGFRTSELATIEAIIDEHLYELLEKWYEFHKRSD